MYIQHNEYKLTGSRVCMYVQSPRQTKSLVADVGTIWHLASIKEISRIRSLDCTDNHLFRCTTICIAAQTVIDASKINKASNGSKF